MNGEQWTASNPLFQYFFAADGYSIKVKLWEQQRAQKKGIEVNGAQKFQALNTFS